MKFKFPNQGPIPTSPGKNPLPIPPKTPSPSPKLTPMQIADIGFRAAESVSNLITTICEQRLKTQALKVESQRISAELEAKIAEEENKTKCFIAQCQADVAKHADETKIRIMEIEREIAEGKNLHERILAKQREEHELNMFRLQVLKSMVDQILAQYTFYNMKNAQSMDGQPIIDIQLLNSLNNCLVGLSQNIIMLNQPPQQY